MISGIKTCMKTYAKCFGGKSVLQILPVKNLQPESLRFLYQDAIELKQLFTTNGTKKLSPKEFQNFTQQTEFLKSENLRGLRIVKNLSSDEKTQFLSKTDMPELKQLLLLATGNKPAVLIGNNIPELRHPDYDIVKRTLRKAGLNFNNTIILDKKAVRKVIEKNLEIYQKRMNLDKNTSIDEIYSILAGEKSPLKDELKYPDLIGLTLGYPKNNTLIYNLRQGFMILNPDKTITKQGLNKFLMSNKSPYENFSPEFKKEISEEIKKMNLNPPNIKEYISSGTDFSVYSLTAFVDEPEAFGNIIQSVRNTINAIEKINSRNFFSTKRI